MKRMVLLLIFPLAAAAQSLPSQPVKPPPRAKIAGSMVGYVDDALVGSQVRVRFEAGFHDDVPDRAEFFYGKCGCFRVGPNPPDKDAAGPGPAASNDVKFQQLYLHTEYAPTSRVSLFAELPFRRLQPGSGFTKTGEVGGPPVENLKGVSDLRAGVKMALAERPGQALTLQVRGYFPTGNAAEGLGTGHPSVEPSLLYYRKLSDRTTLESQVGDWHPTGGSKGTGSTKFAGDVAFYGLGVSHVVYESARFKLVPVAELVGWYVVSGSQYSPPNPNDASGTNIVNVKAGARLIVDEHSSFYAGFGQALTRQVWYEHLARVEYRYSF